MRGSRSDDRHTSPYLGGATLEELRRSDPLLQDLRVWLEGGMAHLSFELLEDRDVEVERSGSPAGPFRVVHSQSFDAGTFVFRDDEYVITENTRYTYYRIRLRALDGEEVLYGWDETWDRYKVDPDGSSYGVTWGAAGVSTPNAPAIIREIRPRFNVMLRQFAGKKTVLYRPAWDSGACSTCTDPATGSAKFTAGPFCPDCFGTGFEGGYYSPILTDRIPSTTEISRILGPIGHSDLHPNARSVMSYWPRVDVNDILRDLDGQIWRVDSCFDGDIHGHSAMCLVELSQLPVTHPINSIPLPAGFRDTSAFPRRQAARATSLESFYSSSTGGAMSSASPVKPVTKPKGEDHWGEDWGE